MGAALAACSDGGRELPMHVIVTDHSVAAWLDAADILPCNCKPFVFPAAGSCSTSTDAGPCSGNPYCPSCITDFAVEENGVRMTPIADGGNDPWMRYYDHFSDGTHALVIAGCGHPTTRISLDGAAFPTATATVQQGSGDTLVSWTTDATTQQALVTRSGGYGADTCFVEGASQYTFAGAGGLGVEVQPLGVAHDAETALGHVTIWRAGDASAQLPAP